MGWNEQVSKSTPINNDKTRQHCHQPPFHVSGNWPKANDKLRNNVLHEELLYFVRIVRVYSILAWDCSQPCPSSVSAKVLAGWGRLENPAASLLEGAQLSFSRRWKTHSQLCCQLEERSRWQVNREGQCFIKLRCVQVGGSNRMVDEPEM